MGVNRKRARARMRRAPLPFFVPKYPGGRAFRARGQSPLRRWPSSTRSPIARRACKPGSVGGFPPDDHSSGPAVARRPQAANPGLWGQASLRAVSANRPLRTRPLFGIAPGGACHAGPVARPAVGSCPTVSPLPVANHGRSRSLWRFPSGCPGRVLPGTVAVLEPGLSSDPCGSAVIRPSARGWGYACGAGGSTGKRRARSSASAASVASAGPLVQGRKRRRKAASARSGGSAGS